MSKPMSKPICRSRCRSRYVEADVEADVGGDVGGDGDAHQRGNGTHSHIHGRSESTIISITTAVLNNALEAPGEAVAVDPDSIKAIDIRIRQAVMVPGLLIILVECDVDLRSWEQSQ
jgi:hypothetical protein